MNKWDKQEDKDNVRYSVIINEMGIKVVDLATGSTYYGSLDGKSFGGMMRAKDFRTLDDSTIKDNKTLMDLKPDRWTRFYNKNFTWKEYCESELGVEYLDNKNVS